MPHVYAAVDSLAEHALVGGGDCVDLVKAYAPGLRAKLTSEWRAGAKVTESTDLKRGTAIATFVSGKYPSNPTGQHAAFFLKRAGAAIWVMDQWKGDEKKPRVSKRIIYPGGPESANTSLSNNADAFYVIEVK
jgi:hypothetical protein